MKIRLGWDSEPALAFDESGEVQEDVLRLMADRLRAEHPGLSWTATWNIVRFYGCMALKLMCLSAAGERIPDVMPEAIEVA